MTKVFCDCCGAEIIGTAFNTKQFSIQVNGAPIQMIINIHKREEQDVCWRCVRAKVIDRFEADIDQENKANKVHVTPPPQFKLSPDDQIGILQSAVKDVVEETFKAQDSLTRIQFVEALMQAIKCGDFVKYVRTGDNAQQVVYLPFQREQELEGKIAHLELLLRVARGIMSRFEPATLGRDFRSATIESICKEVEAFKEGKYDEIG